MCSVLFLLVLARYTMLIIVTVAVPSANQLTLIVALAEVLLVARS
jgi:hypothetical protein